MRITLYLVGAPSQSWLMQSAVLKLQKNPTFSPIVYVGSLPKLLEICAVQVIWRHWKLEPASSTGSILNRCVPLALVLVLC